MRSIALLHLLFTCFSPRCMGMQETDDVFSSGNWARTATTERGIYRIDAKLLKSAGFAPATSDPATLQLYGQPGGMLPQALSADYPHELVEHAIYLKHNGDTRWDEDEYALFYAESPDEYSFSLAEEMYVYAKNLYSDSLYYFLTFKGKKGLRIPVRALEEASENAVLEHFDAYYAYEKESFNLLRSGRRWYGSRLGKEAAAEHIDVPLAPIVGTPIIISSSAAAGCQTDCTLEVALQGKHAVTHHFLPVKPGTYERIAWHAVDLSADHIAAADPLRVSYNFRAGGDAQAYLDYFFLQFQQTLHYTGQKSLFFRHQKALNEEILRYDVTYARDPFALWEVSDGSAPQQLSFSKNSTKLYFSYRRSAPVLPEFVLFSLSDVKNPAYLRSIPSHREVKNAELIIVAAPTLMDQAQRLADFHRLHDKLRVQTISTTQLYRITSAGRPDPTAIRNYAHKHRNRLRYLLLFGAASFDYKEILHEHAAHVPSYPSRSSLDPLTTYVSDDYFGFLDPNEGTWEEKAPFTHQMDIGVGRLPARTAKEARIMVDKIIHYATSAATIGQWRKDVYLVADDGDRNLHSQNIDKLSEQIDELQRPFEVKKFYLDGYPQTHANGQQYSEEASATLDRAVHEGALIFNFSGHGSTSVWTSEKLLSKTQFSSWTNVNKLPLFITATCDFGRFDNPLFVSGGEALLSQEIGGGIAVLSTARPINSDANFELNTALIEGLFVRRDGNYLRLGDVHKEAKNTVQSIGNRSFALLGDPALRLSYPAHQISLTHINDVPILSFRDTLRARSLVVLRGEIQNQQAQLINSYTGIVHLKVYDKKTALRTLGDESSPHAYTSYHSLIFQGKAEVKRGAFQASFVVPQSLSYRKGKANMLFYAEPAADGSDARDGAGRVSHLYVGGPAAEPLVQDTEGPVMTAFLDDKPLVNGLHVGPKPRLRLQLSDELGIKLTGNGLSKTFSLRIDEQPPVALASFYKADVGTYQQGEVVYDIAKLSDGKHHLNVQVWDNYDNFREYDRTFFTSIHTNIELSHVITYPNPTRGRTFFSFRHDKGEHVLETTLEVLDMEGRIVFRNSWLTLDGNGLIAKLVPLGVEQGYVKDGLYAYQLDVSDKEDGTKGRAVGKFIVRR